MASTVKEAVSASTEEASDAFGCLLVVLAASECCGCAPRS
jgi:hypothetical protein